MKFFFATEPDDVHGICVGRVLESIGHSVRHYYSADMPSKQKNSIYISNEADYEWKSADLTDIHVDNDYDLVWWRRPRAAYVPRDVVHEDDLKFMIQENNLLQDAIAYNLAPNARWINAKDAVRRVNTKLLQLKIAKQCGFDIPTTLCSNDPLDVRHFILKHQEQGVIFKPLCANFWMEETQMKMSYTSKVSFLDLPTSQMLQMSPGIYQTLIKKKYELRVTCFGHYAVAAKINSQAYEENQMDWRSIPAHELQIEPYHLPDTIQRKLALFMDKIGISFGSFDFIVTESGEYIFLEVNEQGQFLWVESLNPDIKMLDPFIKFITHSEADLSWQNTPCQFQLPDYSHHLADVIERNRAVHVDLNSVSLYMETAKAVRC
jgi:glutathione synthase/RimK-type ligase-like ATP-grasp enzyme